MNLKGNKRRLINIGCGVNPIKGFVNYDHNVFIFLSKIPILIRLNKWFDFIPFGFIKFMGLVKKFNILYCDASKKIPEKNNSVDLIYSCHMIEHLDNKELKIFFKECERVLKPNGYLRLVVPDFNYLIDIYNKNHNVDNFIKRSELVGKKPKSIIKKIQYLIQGHGWHHQMFNAQSLKEKIALYSFSDIHFFDAGKTSIPFETGINYSDFKGVSLYCECIKSA